MRREFALFVAMLAIFACGNRSRKPVEAEPVQEEIVVAEPLHGPDSLNDAAAVFSGLAVDTTSAYYPITQTAAWKSHAKLIGDRWAPCRKGLDKVESFAGDSLADIRTKARTVLYTFSGPDFVYPAVLFPDADTIIMAALEPVGKVITAKDLDKKAFLRATPALSTLMKSSYFITKSMKDDLGIEGLGGVTPVFALTWAEKRAPEHQEAMNDFITVLTGITDSASLFGVYLPIDAIETMIGEA